MTEKDYVREAMMPLLKNRLLSQKSTIILSELLDHEILERLLSEVVSADELTPDPSVQTADDNKKKNVKATPKESKPAPIRSHIATSSKQGFDVIAGCYVYKSSADQVCAQLKSKGCDAYIINRNGLYYVSMGSAASRTEADAKFNHIKSWYKGDVSIKQW